MPLDGIDHVELWMGNAAQAAYYLRHAYGFTEIAYCGLETGARERMSHVLAQGEVRIVLTGRAARTPSAGSLARSSR
jgi:4-hydroxyphenylpyruvate dioxygenase